MATKQEKLDLLGGVPLFAGLGKRDLQRVLNSAKPTEHLAGEVILTEGQSGVGFHLIVRGAVKVVTNGRTVARLGPGEFFGEMALVDDSPRMATVVAESDLSTMVISKWDVRARVNDQAELAWKLIEHRVFRIREEQSGRSALLS